ncbi:hypothetical protein [Sphingobium sp. DN12]|uniref:hypothetical protein n=1 Tax=Sphingobium sp. DN12 TaxID=3378073 RepID=UPI003DA5A447
MAQAIRTLPRRTAMALKRRSFAEQRVIRMLRGDPTDDRAQFVYNEQFRRLRDLAEHAGMRLNEPGTVWLADHELLLLSWLAQAQRVLGYKRQFHTDATLTLAAVNCAGTLNALGIQFPPITLQHVSEQSSTEDG